jgi:2-aminoethylphosphonate-pyruvate transaminase
MIPFTPAVQVYYAFREALDELLEEGVENRLKRFQGYAATIRTRMQELGIQAVLPPEAQGNTLTAFHLPDGVTYAQLHDGLKQEGYVIYAGQGQLENRIFRVANIGALTKENIDGFLGAFQVTLEKARA